MSLLPPAQPNMLKTDDKKSQKELFAHLEKCNDLSSLCIYARALGENYFCESLKDNIRNHIEKNWKHEMSLLKYKVFSIEETLPFEIIQHSMSFLEPKQRFIICNVSKAFQKLSLQSIKLDNEFRLSWFAPKRKKGCRCKISHDELNSSWFNFENRFKYLKLMSNVCFYDFKTSKHTEIIEQCCNPKLLSHIETLAFIDCEFLVFSEFLKKCAISLSISSNHNKHIFANLKNLFLQHVCVETDSYVFQKKKKVAKLRNKT